MTPTTPTFPGCPDLVFDADLGVLHPAGVDPRAVLARALRPLVLRELEREQPPQPVAVALPVAADAVLTE